MSQSRSPITIPLISAGLALAATIALTAPGHATAQDFDDEISGPPAGAHVQRDYLTGDYYYYHAPRKDKRVDEQLGWRDGVLHTLPRSYWSHCGCSRLYYGNRWYNRPNDLYDYAGQVFDDRAQLDRRTPYEYRWPRRNY